uniref:Venom S1 protease 10 n=1 Tax=Platymeris rhadamanthus TaxID=1134088 RepID=A0A6B9L3W2_PLARH|nr:venom S1 protease 10 [Platymeris rhadamanthus]
MKILITIIFVCISWRLATGDVDSSEYGRGGGTKNPDCRCGWRNNKKSRIVGGDEAGVNEFPWMVGVKESDDIGPGCGGVILSKRIVLTASHCTEPMRNSQIQVLVGEHNIFDKNESPVKQVINVQKFVEHKDYDITDNLDNDIALLYLERDIQMSERVGPICLPTAKSNYVRQKLRVMGWGKLGTNKGPSPILRTVELDGIPLAICAQVYDGINQKAGKVNQFCSFTKNKDSCQGDSGGPVVWRDPEMNYYVVAGLISYGGDECGLSPGVSTDVFFHKNWILENIKKLDPSQKVCQKV